ncbi:hypothetical protein J2Y63_005303 [Shinella sp. BE166]|uniref:hypothetical protein n=1 Tax=Shinella sp. BE166 TaxID=3373918 RepID=UPI003EBABE6A
MSLSEKTAHRATTRFLSRKAKTAPFGFDVRNSDSPILKPDDGLFVPKKIDVLPLT